MNGKPLLRRALETAINVDALQSIVVVAPASSRDEVTDLVAAVVSTSGVRDDLTIPVVDGGAERQDSVRLGLRALPSRLDTVLVHDAARPLASANLYARVIGGLRDGAGDEPVADAVVPALPVTDTIKQVDERGFVVNTPDRSTLRAVQTPQGFRRAALEAAHRAAVVDHVAPPVTDDAAMIERSGGSVLVVPGEVRAEKITTSEDLERAEQRFASGGSRPNQGSGRG